MVFDEIRDGSPNCSRLVAGLYKPNKSMKSLNVKTIRNIVLGLLAIAPSALLAAGPQSADTDLPVATKIVRPYAPELQSYGIKGDVSVIFRLSENGKPRDIVVESSTHSVYADSVVRALRGWKFDVPENLADSNVRYRLPFEFRTN